MDKLTADFLDLHKKNCQTKQAKVLELQACKRHLVLVLWIKGRMVQVVGFDIDRFGKFGSVMDLEDSFWNTMFEKELPKYKDWLDTIFPCCPFETINVNIAFDHVFNHLQNCLINITYVVDLKFLPNLGISNLGDKV